MEKSTAAPDVDAGWGLKWRRNLEILRAGYSSLKRMMIERGAMGQKKEVKLEDIADSLGVSISNRLRNALKGKKRVSVKGCRNRIKEAGAENGI
ncbi:MAG: hypothetical protein ACLS7X_16885 [Mediterraneibacter gnavus]